MKCFVLFVLLFFHFSLKAQQFCVDSSSHIQYVTQDNDSLQILKTILTKDGSKISIGYFLKRISGRDDKFIFKINKKGEMVWFKKIKSTVIGDEFDLGTIEEASNGNLFIGCLRFFTASHYFFYLIFSPSGQLIYQNSITLTNNDIDLTDASNLSFSLISKYGSDSILCLLTHPVIRGNFEPNSFSLVTVSNNGNIGQSHTFVPTFADSYPMYSTFSKCKIENNTIFLYGSAEFNNVCQINLREHLTYTFVKIDWTSKQIIENKAYCSPISGHDVFGYPILDDISHIQIAFLTNGNIVYYQRIYGYDINGSDSVANLFKVSEFSPLFSPIREEYVCSKKIYFNQKTRDYKVFIDSSGNRFISLYTLDGYKVQYAVGTNQGSYLLQKTIQFPTHDNDYQFDLYEGKPVEKGYFITFDIVSHTNKNTYIDNFRLMAKDTSAECFGANENIFFNKPAYGSSIIWDGTYTSQNTNTLSIQSSYTLEDYPMQTNIVCKIINKCDTIKINAPSVVCDISQPVLITA
ncbi:MAG: hypothetical protein JST23_13170, partial [Bacteroidetes bacterium]|nr:hypothetical protein [Bacteroidota bacterium]